MNTKREFFSMAERRRFVGSMAAKRAEELLAMLERVTADAANAYRAIACVNESIIPTANLVTLDQARALIAQIKGE